MTSKLARSEPYLQQGKRSKGFSPHQKFVFFSLSPIVLLFLVFAIIPIVWGIVLSFYQYSPLSADSPFVGLSNFKRLLSDDVFLKSVWVTFKFVFFAVLINLAFTLLIAVGIQRLTGRLRDLFRTIFFLPTIAPLSGAAVVWSTMFNKDGGLFNMILVHFHMHAVNWLSDPKLALFSVIMMTLWADSGYNIVIFMAGLDSISPVYYEAATLDGANRWVVFRHVTLPLLNRTTVFISITTIISYFQAFSQFQVMTKGEPFNETRVLALNIYDNAFTYSNMGYASAMATVLLIIILVVSQMQLKLGRSNWEY